MNIKKASLFLIGFLGFLTLLYVIISFFLNVRIVSTDTLPTPNVMENATRDEIQKDESTSLTFRTNLTAEDLFNLSFEDDTFGSLNLLSGEGRLKKSCVKIGHFTFGDVNNDSNGDAVFELKIDPTCKGVFEKSELIVLINDNDLPTPFFVSSDVLDLGFSSYSNIEIKDQKIVLSFLLETEKISKEFRFKQGKLALVNSFETLKIYKNEIFGFSFAYPDSLFVETRSIIENGKSLKDTLALSLQVPFLQTYNTWNKKSFNLYVRPGVCPYRNDSTTVVRNEHEFKVYDPESSLTSTTQLSKKVREYMTYYNSRCYIFVMLIEGPGPASELFPKKDITAPEHRENFLKLEMILLEQIFDTFRFV